MFFYSESDSEVSQISGGSTDPYFSNVSLLLSMDSDFNDSSDYNHTVVVNGMTSPTSAESKYGGASGDFTSTGKYLQIADHNSLSLSSTDSWTIECWIHPLTGPTGYRAIISKRTPGDSNNEFEIFLDYDTGNLSWVVNGVQYDSSSKPTFEAWNHIAYQSDGSTTKYFLNGVLVHTTTARPFEGSAPLFIGSGYNGGSSFVGYIDDVRITKGVARYTANFTPPTEAHPTQGEAAQPGTTDPYFSNVELLLPMDSNFNDVSSNGYTLTTSGSPSINAANKFGGGSGYFPGTSYVTVAATPELAIGTQDFTIEAWINRGGASGDRFYVFQLGMGFLNGAIQFGIQYGKLTFDIYPTGHLAPNIDTIPGQWHHIAGTRENGIIRTFVDGNMVYESTSPDNTSVLNADMNIGNGPVYGQYFDYAGGQIDDLRLTIGVARYTANFTPPTEAHPTN